MWAGWFGIETSKCIVHSGQNMRSEVEWIVKNFAKTSNLKKEKIF